MYVLFVLFILLPRRPDTFWPVSPHLAERIVIIMCTMRVPPRNESPRSRIFDVRCRTTLLRPQKFPEGMKAPSPSVRVQLARGFAADRDVRRDIRCVYQDNCW